MEEEAAAIEDDRLDAGRDRPAGDQLADGCRRLLVGAALEAALAQLLVEARGRGQRPPPGIVDDLRIDVAGGAEHRKAWPLDLGARDAAANAGATPLEEVLCLARHLSRPLLLLAFLAADRLGLVLDALALVGLGLAEAADHRGDLADALPVGAGDGDRGRLLAGDLDVLGDRELNLVAVSQLQIEALALHRGAIADAVDLEADGEALRDAIHHVVDKGARRPPQRAGTLGVALRLDPHLAVLDRGGNLVADDQLQGAELALGGDGLPGDVDIDAARDGHRVLSYARHGVPLRIRGRGPRRRHWR